MPRYLDDSSSAISGRRFRFHGIPKGLWTRAGLRVGDDTAATADLDVVSSANVMGIRIAAGASEATAWEIRANDTNGQFVLHDDNAVTSPVKLANNAPTDSLVMDSSGNVGFGTGSPTELVDVNGDAIRIRTSSTPASASASGAVGEIRWDSSFVYVCTATDTWKRAALSSW